jgi:DNA adenine methylase
LQLKLFKEETYRIVKPFNAQLLKWVGNKQRFAHEIISYFPVKINRYFEPFLGSGAVLGAFAYEKSIGSDIFKPLIDIWTTLCNDPELLKIWYADRWNIFMNGDKVKAYEQVKASYNASPNGPDLLFLSRSCYGGVVRFRSSDGYMSTPCGVHSPISPASFSRRVDEWHKRTSGTKFLNLDYADAMEMAEEGDLIYCDPPYLHSQPILYGGQSFSLENLFKIISKCKSRGVYVALSIDGTKRSGKSLCELPIPKGLFKRELFVNCGRSMLKRFQMEGQTLENEIVSDRLLLTY